MDVIKAMEKRHSVRRYKNQPLDREAVAAIQAEIDACNKESDLHIQLVTDEPKAFNGFMAHYGKFSGVKNYIALIGKKDSDPDEKCGYYGERLVLKAQQLGLNTCWVAMTYSKVKTAFTIEPGEKLCVVISIGYGETQGSPHKSKDISQVARTGGEMSEWFRRGVEAALLAPTAMNQQKFMLIQDGENVTAKAGKGFYTKLDMGIVKYHFEVAAGKDSFYWS